MSEKEWERVPVWERVREWVRERERESEREWKRERVRVRERMSKRENFCENVWVIEILHIFEKYCLSSNNLRWKIVSFSKQYELLYIQGIQIKMYEWIKEVLH